MISKITISYTIKNLLKIKIATETYIMTHHKTDTLQPRPYLLSNKVQHYAWGSCGDHAFIPKLIGILPENDTTYAELWMGAHPSAPSKIRINEHEAPLTDLINQFPEQILGKSVQHKFNGKLPFLFKVLSAEQALSIQAHPNKRQAVRLHSSDPEHYPDDNHKPEIAIALDSLTALVGFKSIPDLASMFERYPEFSNFISSDIAMKFRNGINEQDRHRDILKEMYSRYIENSISRQDKLAQATDSLEARLRSSKSTLTEEENLFLEQKKIYNSDDVGLFSIFLLNLVHLKKGEGVFLDAGIPHAYIKGNIVECMANSDNVVRAGLTPKFKDVRTLVDILTYESGSIPILNCDENAVQTLYPVPVSEFEISRWQLSAGNEWNQVTNQAPQIILIIEGAFELKWNNREELYRQGDSIFIPASVECYQACASENTLIFCVNVPA